MQIKNIINLNMKTQFKNINAFIYTIKKYKGNFKIQTKIKKETHI